jgi:SagB-type dehydrogenase family enzyme
MKANRLTLPTPRTHGELSIESAVLARRSVREFMPGPLTLNDVSQLLWAAQGFTRGDGLRAAPSAGALFPLEIYLIAGAVEDLEPGIYRYLPAGHQLELVSDDAPRQQLASAARDQEFVRDAPISIVVAAVHQRTAQRYGERAGRYIDQEVGCVAENVALQAVALNLGTVIVGAFDDARVHRIVGLSENEDPRCILPVGEPG